MEQLQHAITFASELVHNNLYASLVTLAAAIVLLIVFRFFHSYRRLKKLKVETDKSWSNIQTLLTQRNNEIPKLLGMCRKVFSRQDRPVLEQMISARKHIGAASSSGDIGKLAIAEGMIRKELNRILKTAESYSDFVQQKEFKMLRAKIIGYNNAISDRSTQYNTMVRETNARLSRRTGNMAAGMLEVEAREELIVPSDEITSNDLTTLFAS